MVSLYKIFSMKNIFLAAVAFGMLSVSCQKKTENSQDVIPTDTLATHDEHTAQSALDWMGTYEATLPCADCPGIKTIIGLNENQTFQISSEYLERDTKIEDSGEVMWHDNGSVVHLKGKDTDIKLKVIENGLIYLDQEGKEIEGDLANLYRFKKIN